jgi:hypothetical protein
MFALMTAWRGVRVPTTGVRRLRVYWPARLCEKTVPAVEPEDGTPRNFMVCLSVWCWSPSLVAFVASGSYSLCPVKRLFSRSGQWLGSLSEKAGGTPVAFARRLR